MTPQQHTRAFALLLLPAYVSPAAMASAGYFVHLLLLGALAALVAWKFREGLGRDRTPLIVGAAAMAVLGVVSYLAWGAPSPTLVLVIQLVWLAYVIKVTAKLIYTSIEPRTDAGD